MGELRKTVARHRSQTERPSVRATVREGELVWTNVSLHLKGAAGSFRSVDDKPALTLNFDKFPDGQRFHGLQKISLNNSVQDASYVHEKICRDLFRAAGMPVPRTDYATVELNGRRLGLFVLVEGWNKQFLRALSRTSRATSTSQPSLRILMCHGRRSLGNIPRTTPLSSR